MNIYEFLTARNGGKEPSDWVRFLAENVIEPKLIKPLYLIGGFFFQLPPAKVISWIHGSQYSLGAKWELARLYAEWVLAEVPKRFENVRIADLLGDAAVINGKPKSCRWKPSRHNFRNEDFASEYEWHCKINDSLIGEMKGSTGQDGKRKKGTLRGHTLRYSWLLYHVECDGVRLSYRSLPICVDLCNESGEVAQTGTCGRVGCSSVIAYHDRKTVLGNKVHQPKQRFFRSGSRVKLQCGFCNECMKRVPFKKVGKTKICKLCESSFGGGSVGFWFLPMAIGQVPYQTIDADHQFSEWRDIVRDSGLPKKVKDIVVESLDRIQNGSELMPEQKLIMTSPEVLTIFDIADGTENQDDEFRDD